MKQIEGRNILYHDEKVVVFEELWCSTPSHVEETGHGGRDLMREKMKKILFGWRVSILNNKSNSICYFIANKLRPI